MGCNILKPVSWPWPRPFQGRFFISRMQKMGWFGVVRGHSRSTAMSILYRFRDIAAYLSKVADFDHSTCIRRPRRGWPRSTWCVCVLRERTELKAVSRVVPGDDAVADQLGLLATNVALVCSVFVARQREHVSQRHARSPPVVELHHHLVDAVVKVLLLPRTVAALTFNSTRNTSLHVTSVRHDWICRLSTGTVLYTSPCFGSSEHTRFRF